MRLRIQKFACGAVLALTICLAVARGAEAQQMAGGAAAMTTADYARAEKFMGYNTTPLGVSRRSARELAGRRAVLVSRHDCGWKRVCDGRCGEGNARAGV